MNTAPMIDPEIVATPPMSTMAMNDNNDGIGLTPEQLRRRRARSIAIAVSLAILVGLFYAVTGSQMGASAAYGATVAGMAGFLAGRGLPPLRAAFGRASFTVIFRPSSSFPLNISIAF